MIKAAKSGSAFIFLIFFSLVVFGADEINVKLSVNPNDLEVGERFAVSVEVSSEGMVSVDNPAPPKIDGAEFLSGSSSQRINSFTGTNAKGELEFKTVQTRVYSFVYQATKNGDIVVPSVTVSVGGRPIKSATAQIKVWAEGVNKPKNQRPSRPNQIEEDEMDPFFFFFLFKEGAKM